MDKQLERGLQKTQGDDSMKWRNRRQMFSGDLTMVLCSCRQGYWSYGTGEDVLSKCWEMVDCRCEE